MKLHFVWRFNTPNTGDIMSSPRHYFEFPGATVMRHDYKTFRFDRVDKRDAVIVGGGVARNMLMQPRRAGPLVIGWGIGTSIHGRAEPLVPPLEYGGNLNGLRDWPVKFGDGYTHVPCASCWHPWFHKVVMQGAEAPRHEAVLFLNNDKGAQRHVPEPWRVDGLPVGNNHMPIEAALDFLASGATVVTNSYHGAYWGQLMGRRVVQINAYSSKFHGFRWPIAIARPDEDWRTAEQRDRAEHGFTSPGIEPLTYARWQNKMFHHQVTRALERRAS